MTQILFIHPSAKSKHADMRKEDTVVLSSRSDHVPAKVRPPSARQRERLSGTLTAGPSSLGEELQKQSTVTSTVSSWKEL